MQERKLYALITNPISDNPKPKVIQVSFNKEELEEIAEYLNQFTYFSPRASVKEVNENVCEYYWPK